MTIEVKTKLVIVLIINNHLSQAGGMDKGATAFVVPLSYQSLVPELYYKKQKSIGAGLLEENNTQTAESPFQF